MAAGAPLADPVVVYDFDNYYMGGVLAEHLAARRTLGKLRDAGGSCLGAWTIMSNEQPQVHRALSAAGIALHTL